MKKEKETMLRKVVFIAVVFLGLTNSSTAQKISVGIVGGTFISSATQEIEISQGTGYDITSREGSPLLGLRGEYHLNQHLTIGIGATWQQLNYKGKCYCDFCGKISRPPVDLSIEMLDIPIYLRAFFRGQKKLIAPFVAIGISNQFSKMEEVDFGYKFNLNSALGSFVNINDNWSALLEFELNVNPLKRVTRFSIDEDFQADDYPYFHHKTVSLKAGIFRKF